MLLALSEDGSWLDRIKGMRSNASTASHAELDEAEELDAEIWRCSAPLTGLSKSCCRRWTS